MKIKIYGDDLSKPTIKRAGLANAHVFDGYMARIIELNDVQIHSVKDIEALQKILECAKPCFRSGNKGNGYFEGVC